MTRLAVVVCVVGSVMVGACGGDDVDPMLIAGGGAASGPIDGKLHVYAIDEDTDEVLAGATVLVGDESKSTDATGLASFDVSGKQTVTVTASGYRASTLIGIDAANLTIPLGVREPTVPTATVRGTIDGWDDLPAPQTDHFLVGIVGASMTDDFDDPANELQQGMVGDLPANACAKAGAVSVCDFTLVTRTGPQLHYAIIADVDTKGTPSDADDTATLVGYAVRGGLDLQDGQQITGETLVMVPSVEEITVDFEPSPAGSTQTLAAPVLRLGDEGMILFFVPQITPSEPTGMVPSLTGDLADGTWELIGRAQDATESLSSTILLRGPSFASTVTLGAWMPIPSVPEVSGATFSFTPVAGADLVTVDLDLAGETQWGLAIFDDTTSFTLPTVSPDPLPSGALTMKVSATEVEGWDPRDFRIEELRDRLTRGSDNSTAFTH